MSTSTVAARLGRISRSQLLWVGGGLAVVFLVIVIAHGNLTAIYRAQPDFVVGSMLSFTGFCFAKASIRTDVESAVELIQKGENSEIADVLDTEVRRRLHVRHAESTARPRGPAGKERQVVAARPPGRPRGLYLGLDQTG
jgi:hypothetical protein